MKKSAFTLVEVVVAVAVASVIGYFVISFSISLLQVWKVNQRSVGTELDANIVLDILAADLQNAVRLSRNDDAGVVFSVTVMDRTIAEDEERGWEDGSLRASVNDFDPAVHSYGWGGSWLRFFAAAPTLNAVAYQIVRRQPYEGATFHRYGLFRSVVSQHLTEDQDTGFDLSAGIYADPAFSYDDPEDSTDDADFGYPATIAQPNLKDLLAENVVDFGIRIFAYDADALANGVAPKGMMLLFPFATFDAAGNPSWDTSNRTFVADSFSTYPDVAEVFLRVLDSEGARLLEEGEKNKGGQLSYDEIVERHGILFSRMIEIGIGGSQ